MTKQFNEELKSFAKGIAFIPEKKKKLTLKRKNVKLYSIRG